MATLIAKLLGSPWMQSDIAIAYYKFNSQELDFIEYCRVSTPTGKLLIKFKPLFMGIATKVG